MTTRRGDALLQLTHLVGQRGLVTHGGRHATEQRGDLGAGLGEAEDVVDEQQHVLLLHVAEVLRHRQRRQGDAQTRARRLVHLAEDQRGLADDARLGHLTEEVVALAGALTDTGEHRHTGEVLRNAVDHLLDEDGLADTGTAEQADLAALDVGGQQVDDLDAGPEDLGLALELVEARSLRVDATALGDLERGLLDVQRLAEGVPHVAQGHVADGHRDGVAGVAHRGTAHETIGRLHGDGAHHVVADVLGNLERERAIGIALDVVAEADIDVQGVVELRHRLDGELHVDDRAGDPGHATDAGRDLSRCSHGLPRLLCGSGERVGPADDLADLLGDLGLAGLVGLTAQGLDELFGVVRRRLHGAATGCVLGGR